MFLRDFRHFAFHIIHQVCGFDVAGFAFIRLVSGNGVEADPSSAGLADGWALFFSTFHLT